MNATFKVQRTYYREIFCNKTSAVLKLLIRNKMSVLKWSLNSLFLIKINSTLKKWKQGLWRKMFSSENLASHIRADLFPITSFCSLFFNEREWPNWHWKSVDKSSERWIPFCPKQDTKQRRHNKLSAKAAASERTLSKTFAKLKILSQTIGISLWELLATYFSINSK